MLLLSLKYIIIHLFCSILYISFENFMDSSWVDGLMSLTDPCFCKHPHDEYNTICMCKNEVSLTSNTLNE